MWGYYCLRKQTSNKELRQNPLAGIEVMWGAEIPGAIRALDFAYVRIPWRGLRSCGGQHASLVGVVDAACQNPLAGIEVMWG